jgi:hypothetical protein
MSDLQKAEIFAHLEEFFSRYYKDGDFLSLRKYADKNAIPYKGRGEVRCTGPIRINTTSKQTAS